jgi:hypothetical protein
MDYHVNRQNLFVRVVWESDEKLKISFIFVESEKILISGNHTTATIVT